MSFWKNAGKIAAVAALGTAAVGAVAITGAAIADMTDAERDQLVAALNDRQMSRRNDEQFLITRRTTRGLFPREVIRVEKKNRYGRTLQTVEMTTEEVFGETRTTVRRGRRLY